jgi:kumamolisin
MAYGWLLRTLLVFGVIVVSLSVATSTVPAAQAATNGLLALPDDMAGALQTAQLVGAATASSQMTIELSLLPNHAAQVDQLLAALYTPGSAQYGHWLPTGAFEAMFGPTAAQQTRFNAYMAAAGLHPVGGSPSAFLVRYAGTTAAVEAAFHTRINQYRLANGQTGFANASAPMIPATLAGTVQGVIGLDDLVSDHPLYDIAHPLAANYAGGPNSTGLVPSQIRSMYNANPIYPHTNGNGLSIGLFELSNWQLADIVPYEQQFHLYHTPLHSVMVNGGPGADHSGATEVMLDIEMQLALAPGVKGVYVYDAPNTDTGLIDEYALIAHQNLVAALSTSWGACEPDTTTAVRNAENTSFKMMAAEGMSVFAAAGDLGSYACEYLFGGSKPPAYANAPEVLDPASNPYVTAVGGTSFFGTYDPGTTANPAYPTGEEYVWNTLNNCTDTVDPDTNSYCPFGAGGGGVSQVWGRPAYQYGPGVSNSLSRSGAYCHQASGVACREVPDVSINADPNSGYSVYCSDSGDGNCTGWFQVGGTSAGAPLWAAIATLADGYHHHRFGLMNYQLYTLLRNANNYTRYFHDMNLPGVLTYKDTLYSVYTNGAYSQTAAYDMATGIGTPNIQNVVIGM